MSMLSAQVDELRELALWLEDEFYDEYAERCRDAADTIWKMWCKLVDAEDRVRKSVELCKLCEREAENAKLREELDAAKHDLSVFSGEIVASKAENGKLRERVAELEELLPDSGRWYRAETVEAYVAEIAKLRELAAILCHCMQIKASCDDCRIGGRKGELARDPLCACDGLHRMLRELGFETGQ